MINVVCVKFKEGGKPYYFAPDGSALAKGDVVIVETAQGMEYAFVVNPCKEVDENEVVSPLKPILRKADENDLAAIKYNRERKVDALKVIREKIAARGLEMKPIGLEFAFDQSKVTIFFTAESRVDFRELIRDLSAAFHMRIELRQVAIRDEVKLLGGIGPCGRECCCMHSLQDGKKVTVKMAKTQGLSLNPTKISGMCGRLMCCLYYENDYYSEVSKIVPKVGTMADTPDGRGVVINVNMLNMEVKVKIGTGDDVKYRDFPVDKIAFMKGNVLMGKVGGDEAEDEEGEEILRDEDASATEAAAEPTEKLPQSRGAKERRNGDRNKNGNRRNGDGNAEGANGGDGQGRPAGGESRNAKRNNKNKNKNRNGNRPNGNGANTNRPNGNGNGANGGERQGRPAGGENRSAGQSEDAANVRAGGRDADKNLRPRPAENNAEGNFAEGRQGKHRHKNRRHGGNNNNNNVKTDTPTE